MQIITGEKKKGNKKHIFSAAQQLFRFVVTLDATISNLRKRGHRRPYLFVYFIIHTFLIERFYFSLSPLFRLKRVEGCRGVSALRWTPCVQSFISAKSGINKSSKYYGKSFTFLEKIYLFPHFFIFFFSNSLRQGFGAGGKIIGVKLLSFESGVFWGWKSERMRV